MKQLYGDKLEFHASYFDKVLGTSTVREALERGEPVEKIVAGLPARLGVNLQNCARRIFCITE